MRYKHAVLAWLALVTLAVVSGAAADVSGRTHLGWLPLVLIASATAVKARLILRYYLHLHALPGLLAGLGFSAAAILATVTASLLIVAP
jgi:hypothetical protein